MKMVHVTIMSKDINRSVEFYRDVIGLKVGMDTRGTDHEIVFLAENQGDVSVEICQNPEAAFHGGGISMGFPVEDLDAAYSRMQELGLCPGPVISPNPHVKFFFIKDPNGVEIQLLQNM